MGKIVDIRPFDTRFRSITNLQSYGDAERISGVCKVDPSADEPIDKIVARCMRSGRLDLNASGCVRDRGFSDVLHPEERDGFDIVDLSQDDESQAVISKQAATVPPQISGDVSPKVASGAADATAGNGNAAGAAVSA